MKTTGMTVIELVIVLAICGILAAIGSASYSSQRHTQRLYAMRAALIHLEAEQANQLLLTQTYATSMPSVNDKRFSIRVMNADSRDFTIKATSATDTGSGCDELTITSTSRQPDKCWK
ncbi:type IV pilin protein [Alteromonas sp. H39]|uniref:type IV pilin protein n=1 Tax=Alteromonas sp. H39 TaxID=3389876 RepID=UPI0039E1CA81